MLIKSKYLGDAGWKDLASKNKIKDNGLSKALERLKRVGDDDHDEKANVLEEVVKLAAQLKKDKAVAAAAPVAKYLAELQGDAEAAAREAAKSKAEHDKARKAKAEAEKRAAAKAGDDEDEDEADESPELLTTKLKPLLRLVAKGETMHTLVAKSGKQVLVMMSRKPIPPARRKMLAEQLGGGSTKYYPGVCSLEAGATTFSLKSEVAGMAKLVKLALLQQTGLRVNKVKCRGEDGDDHDDDEGAPQDGDQPGAQPGAATGQRTRPTATAAPAPKPDPGLTAFAPAASADSSTAPIAADSAPVVPLMAPGEMHDEEVAAAIVDKQIAILEGWRTALGVFQTTMTSSADDEAKADYQGVVLGFFRDKLVGELLKRAPLASELKALADVIDGETQRAAKAHASATLRDFINQHNKDIGKLVQATQSQRQGFISAVRARRQAAGVDEPSQKAAQKPGTRKPVGKAEINPKSLEAWTTMRLGLMDTLEAVTKVLGDSTPEKLTRVLTEAWIRQGTVGKIAGQLIQAVVIIRLYPNLSVNNAHIMASGGQKLAEQLLRDSPGGVDVFGLKTRKRILHYDEHDVPQATLELDANNRDLTAPADKNAKYEALKKYVMTRGLPPTKKLTGD
jgi:hypothetical protein